MTYEVAIMSELDKDFHDFMMFENQAKRSERRPRYDLIPHEVLEAIAERFSIGAEKYGDDNWKKGGPEFFKDAINHALHHFEMYIHGDESEESKLANLQATAWNVAALLWWEKTGKQNWDHEHQGMIKENQVTTSNK